MNFNRFRNHQNGFETQELEKEHTVNKFIIQWICDFLKYTAKAYSEYSVKHVNYMKHIKMFSKKVPFQLFDWL